MFNATQDFAVHKRLNLREEKFPCTEIYSQISNCALPHSETFTSSKYVWTEHFWNGLPLLNYWRYSDIASHTKICVWFTNTASHEIAWNPCQIANLSLSLLWKISYELSETKPVSTWDLYFQRWQKFAGIVPPPTNQKYLHAIAHSSKVERWRLERGALFLSQRKPFIKYHSIHIVLQQSGQTKI